MKKYERPEIEKFSFDFENIMIVSGTYKENLDDDLKEYKIIGKYGEISLDSKNGAIFGWK